MGSDNFDTPFDHAGDEDRAARLIEESVGGLLPDRNERREQHKANLKKLMTYEQGRADGLRVAFEAIERESDAGYRAMEITGVTNTEIRRLVRRAALMHGIALDAEKS